MQLVPVCLLVLMGSVATFPDLAGDPIARGQAEQHQDVAKGFGYDATRPAGNPKGRRHHRYPVLRRGLTMAR
jgi:hypothetical protein